jgi:hypothetical protein
MKSKLLIIAALFLINLQAEAQRKNNTQGMYKHIVMFKFKEASSKASVDSIISAFILLKEQIPVIKGFEWGLNDSPEHLDQGITHCFAVTFASAADRDNVYQDHPAHVQFKKLVGPHVEKVIVVDYKVE